MFSVREKRLIADKIQELLRSTNHPELPDEEIQFEIFIRGKTNMSWAKIKNNGAVKIPDINPHNEEQDNGRFK